ncbi:protein-disulfide reductase DsbD family protein [Acetobacter syzygii]|uniref:Cytochrome C biogenesis protein n=1 Tax=Acetobacter syzygii TaxID=146476 RepID=A0A270BQL6_9PROT|nr:protein-disulfide reductase DsbD domain-containing protein [Acetobacter syzygii]PAL27310.1 cytochrome C biogenesis protein [Acetobacter syzygii]PAL27688.1 cytochrome C biogenesis protein [Acetobacter syzygii]
MRRPACSTSLLPCQPARHKPRWVRGLGLAMLLCVGLAPHGAQAAQSAPVQSAHSTATLITDSNTAQADAPLHAALRLQLKPGWHTYWLNPGDAGDPVTLTVEASGALAGQAQTITWPTPQRIRDASLMSYAYTGDVVLPVTLQLHTTSTPDTQGQVSVHAQANWLVCEQACIPEEGNFTLTLPTGAPQPSAEAPLFAQAAQHTPVKAPYKVTISPTGVLHVHGAELTSQSVADAWFMPQERGQIAEAAPQRLTFEADGLSLHLKPTDEFAKAAPLTGILVLRDPSGAERALNIQATPQPLAASPELGPASAKATVSATPAQQDVLPVAQQAATASLFHSIVLGLLGGLVLNLMPCVFPILAMKALAVARMGQSERKHQKLSAMGYAGGVIVGFTGLGALVMGLRLGGAATGWGFQFQSTMFVGMITWLLFAMALNLLGVFAFLPPALSASTQHRHGLVHDVLTGLLAVVVASPCTAPFMGVAIAGALAGPPLSGLVIFAALGVGLAAPYVLLAFSPALASHLPRPGVWMDYLRQFLAFPLLGTCVWLLWVATVESGATTVLLLCAGMVFMAFAAWIYGIAQKRQRLAGHSRGCTALYGVALLGLLGAMALLPALQQLAPQPATSTPALPNGTEPFSTLRLNALHAAGKPVFVDMTAAWCITCLVNERVALNTTDTQAAMARYGVTTLRGDWTRRDPAITEFLQHHGRDGVPFYLFVPAQGNAVVLPQILTPGLVIGTITPPHG